MDGKLQTPKEMMGKHDWIEPSVREGDAYVWHCKDCKATAQVKVKDWEEIQHEKITR